MDSSAYATGHALVAMHAAGSWYVRSRAMTFQPYFDAGFPHGFDQWISAAGTSFANMALSAAAPARATMAMK